jgi:AcrR family transcriptional regulator
MNAVVKPLDVAPVEDARARLVHAGLRLFAQQGYTKTSTREIAEAASVNVASISYYFGDKAGLYRAVFTEPLGSPEEDLSRFAPANLTLRQALQGFFAGFLEPMKAGDMARLCTKLHFREMVEPTGICNVNESLGIEQMHSAMVEVIRRSLGLAQADDNLARLVMSLAGLGVHLHVCRDINDQIAPHLYEGEEALNQWSEVLVRYGLAMVRAEAEVRGLPLPDPDNPPIHV